MDTQIYSPDETRKAEIRAGGTLNAIDYLEVLDDAAPEGSPPQQTLLLHCFRATTGLDRDNVRIEGGVRVSPVRVVWAHPADAVPPELLSDAEQAYLSDPALLPAPERILVVRVDRRGDFSSYSLRLQLSPVEPDEPPAGFDRLLRSIAFSFKVDCPSEFDCHDEQACAEQVLPAPPINYLAKDYAGFRRLMLDRMAVTMPQWRERNPADLQIALVELLAYAADRLSYYQDAVATEAYLGTARRRVSVRRHARLVDYAMHEGCAARAWVCFEVEPGSSADGAVLPPGSMLLSHDADWAPALHPDELTRALAGRPAVFQTLHDVRLAERRNAIELYTWRETNACLPRGATRATLLGSAAELGLAAGDVLVLEEVRGALTGLLADADPAHRHPVRLCAAPRELTDPLTGATVLEIDWYAEDALPFAVCLREWDIDGQRSGTSVARGNTVLADHGLAVNAEPLNPETVPDTRRYRPQLGRPGLAFAVSYDAARERERPAALALRLDPRMARAEVSLSGDGEIWQPQHDLLNSDRFAPEFVVETERDGRAYMRFGDGVLGRRPAPGARFTARYRVGGGSAGNVGAGAISSLVTELSGIRRVRNPLPATGGVEPEPLEQVRLLAPDAFRTQERAVTPDDYARAAERHPDVQRAAATRRWTGSWHTMFVTVDRAGGRPVDQPFERELRAFMERFRMAGYDLEIDAPSFVALDIAFGVCVKPGYVPSDVKRALLDVFSARVLPDGRRGFFHADDWTFGQPVYLSRLVAAAMAVPGVDWIDVGEQGPTESGQGSGVGGQGLIPDPRPLTPGPRFQRWGEPPHGELAAGQIRMSRLEIARLDNDPSRPENGRIELFMRG